MSSPSRPNYLQEEHWPSLQPCISMMPCSNAPRRIVCSSSTSISMPTGSNRTTCLSDMAPLADRALEMDAGRRAAGRALGPPPLLVTVRLPDPLIGYRSPSSWRCAASGVFPDVVAAECLPLLKRHLVMYG